MFTKVGILAEGQVVLVKSCKLQEQFRKAVDNFELKERSSAKRSQQHMLLSGPIMEARMMWHSIARPGRDTQIVKT